MKVKQRIHRASRLVLLALALPLFPAGYFAVVDGPKLNRSIANPRNVPKPELRGRILDRAGTVLATTRGKKRYYPLGKAAAHVVGYFDLRLATSGSERLFDEALTGKENPRDLDETLKADTEGTKGRDVVLSIDAELQEMAYSLLAGRKGAVAMLYVPTGEPLVLATYPSFDPSTVGENWDTLNRDPDTPLLNRAVAGAYPPGSTFKVLTGLAALSEGLIKTDQTFMCNGGFTIGDYTIPDHGGAVHGQISLSDAVVVSCNVTFSSIGYDLGLDNIARWMKLTRLLQVAEGIPDSAPGLAPDPSGGKTGAAQAGFGQGSLLATPLGMARLTAIIAREGKDVEPELRRAEKARHQTRETAEPKMLQTVADEAASRYMRDAMVAVVKRGTGGAAAVEGFTVGGKTGTAENSRPEPHAWFIAFAPAEEPLFAIAVVVENVGYGGEHAAPIAQKLLEKALKSRLGPGKTPTSK